MEQWKQEALRQAIHIDRRSQLPRDRDKAFYFWEGGSKVLHGSERQVLDALRRSPISCSSRMQLSAYVSVNPPGGAALGLSNVSAK